MGDNKNNNQLCKVVYFDEESITDYIQIIKGGKLEKTTELLEQGETQAEASVEGKASLGVGGMFKALVGMESSISTDSSLQTAFNTQEMARNIIKNTILTDFINIIDDDDNKDGKSIEAFEGYSISIHKDSLTYVALISPYLAMIKGGPGIPSGDYNIAIDKLDNAMKSAKGYYDFIGKKDKKTVIFRFNIKSFKNNYKVTDLLRMDIVLYAIKVGKSSISKLDFNSELDIEPTAPRDNPTYDGNIDTNVVDKNSDIKLDVFDVLLAGVKAYDK